jgi:hypothetical protein
MDPKDIRHRFNYHPPSTEQRQSDHEDVRQSCEALAHELNTILPEGREKSLAITNLEQVMFWANAAIARHRPQPERPSGVRAITEQVPRDSKLFSDQKAK